MIEELNGTSSELCRKRICGQKEDDQTGEVPQRDGADGAVGAVVELHYPKGSAGGVGEDDAAAFSTAMRCAGGRGA